MTLISCSNRRSLGVECGCCGEAVNRIESHGGAVFQLTLDPRRTGAIEVSR